MMYDLYAGTSNHDNKHVGTSYIGKYTLQDKAGVEQEITRSEIFDNAHFKYNQFPVTFRAVYDSDKAQISNTVGFTFDQSPLAETNGSLSFSPGASSKYEERTIHHTLGILARKLLLYSSSQLSLEHKPLCELFSYKLRLHLSFIASR